MWGVRDKENMPVFIGIGVLRLVDNLGVAVAVHPKQALIWGCLVARTSDDLTRRNKNHYFVNKTFSTGGSSHRHNGYMKMYHSKQTTYLQTLLLEEHNRLPHE